MYDYESEKRPSTLSRVMTWKRRLKIAGAVIGFLLTLAGGFTAGDAVGDFDDDDATCVELDD